MSGKNFLVSSPPYQVEQAVKKLGANLRSARLRRNLSLAEVAERIGVGRHTVAAAEKGKLTSSIATYAALLWIFNMTDELESIAAPITDEEGRILDDQRARRHASKARSLDNDF